MSFLNKNKDIENNEKLTEFFLSKSSNKKNNEIIANLAESINNLKPGQLFPNIKLVNNSYNFV